MAALVATMDEGRRRGFSLIEVTLVMAIVATLAAIAVPRYTNALSNYRVDGAARRIVADLALTQQTARTASAGRTVSFDVNPDTYQMTGVADLKNGSVNYIVRLHRDPYRADIVAVDLGGDTDLAYDGFGSPDSGGTIDIRSGNRQVTITVDPETGRATVSPITPAP